MGTLEVRFDARGQEAIIKDEAMRKYQENCYMLGRVFCSGAETADATCSDDEGNDECLGQLMDNYDDLEEAKDDEENEGFDEEEVLELQEAFKEMAEDFKRESADR